MLVVQLDGHISEDDLEAVVASLAPTTADALIAGVGVRAPPPPEPEPPADPTPNVTEDAIRAYDEAPLLVPAVLPPGYELRRAMVRGTDETAAPCLTIQLTYGHPDRGVVLFLELLSRECAERFSEQAFSLTFGGHPSRTRGGERDVLVGETVVEIGGGFTTDEREIVAASLEPITADALIAAVVPG